MKPERRVVRSYSFVPLMLWGIFLLTLGYFLFFSEETVMTDVAISGNDRISVTDLEGIVHSDMAGKYFQVFSRSNFFFLPERKMLSDISNFSPYIKSVRAERIFPKGLVVRIEERPSVIVWRSTNGDFLLAEDGSVRNHPNLDSVFGSQANIIVLDEDGRETADGESVTTPGVVSYIPEYKGKFESRFGKSIVPEVRMISRFSGELRFHVEGEFDMMVDSHQSIDDTLMTLQAALERGIPESDRDRLARVDLRTANKVYYTVKGE